MYVPPRVYEHRLAFNVRVAEGGAAQSAPRGADGGAALVGIDSYNIDDTADGRRPVHSILLGAGVPVVEHMCGLGRLPREGFRFFAVPVKVRGLGTFPVRAFAVVEVLSPAV